MSDNYPEQKYNWLTSELYTFKTLDGISELGVLHKPENFDPAKKYPVIVQYYETMSNDLNMYHRPELSSDRINIPWYVSRGYLVFSPDIHYKVGTPGRSAYNSIVGAAYFLKKFRWVDSSKMGIQGHSHGGFETNYVITHTDFFAAAVSAAGPSDCISGYAIPRGDGGSGQFFFETHQSRIGATLWEVPELYIENSAVFRTDKVNTPVLIMHNKKDGAVDFSQGVEFFTGLRRLGKRAWMLQYDGEVHSISNEAAQLDYTIRMDQFFDHYLKGKPAPKWMTRGIPASMKAIDDGFELDHQIKTPGEGLLTRDEEERLKVLQNRKAITLTFD